MRFSSKVFLSTVLVVILSFSIGGYVLISSLFHAALDREVSAALNENRMLRYSYEAILSGAPEATPSLFGQISDNISTGTGPGQDSAVVRIYTKQLETVYESADITLGGQLLYAINEETRGYQIHEVQGRYYLQSACKLKASNGEPFYLESIREISSVFKLREEQFSIFGNIMIVLSLISGVITFVLSTVLTRPIRKLAGTARRIAGGELSQRVTIGTKDEIGQLAGDFNHMAVEIEQRILQLEDMNRKQEDFIASFAHELKTPLTSIIGYADMLRSKELSREEQFLSADYIFWEGKRLENLSLKLLELIVLGKQDFEKKLIPVGYLFDSVRAFILPAIDEGKIRLQILAEQAVLRVEPDLFKTLLINLLDNARKAVEGEGELKLIGKWDKDEYHIYVYDNGKGIRKQDIPRITEAFYVADKSRARSQGGAGLGLAISNEIARLHGSAIVFQSAPGKGTVACLALKEAEHG